MSGAKRQTPAQRVALYALYKAQAKRPRAAYEEAAREYEALRTVGVDFLDPEDDAYPERLRRRLNAPPWLFYRGSRPKPLRLLRRPGVAIVGARNASPWGLRCAEGIALGLARRGVNIISGYARGVDRMAHYGALQAPRGGTTLVLSEGILHFAPKGELREVEDWERRTLILSPFPPTAPWRPSQAMSRNSIICALADLVVVVEAGPERDEKGKRSGTFHSGKTALELGVPLFVVEYREGQRSLLDSSEELPQTPEGNRALLARGGRSLPLDPHKWEKSLREAVRTLYQALG